MLKYLKINSEGDVKKGEGITYELNSDTLWIFLEQPNEKELKRISGDFEIDIAILKNYTKEQRSKRYSTTPLEFVMVDYFVNGNQTINKTNILIIIKKNVLITIFPTQQKIYEEFFNEIHEDFIKRHKNDKNIGHVLYEFLDRDIQDNYDVLKLVEEKITHLEKLVIIEKEKASAQIHEILKLKKELFNMSRRFWSTSKIIFLIKKGLINVDITERTLKLLDDIYDTFQHQIEILTSQREMLSDSLTLYQTSVSNSLAKISNDINVVMKKLTSLTVIVMLPTLIASIYGMNFKYLPQTDSITGFYEAIAIMLGIGTITYYLFHKKDWI